MIFVCFVCIAQEINRNNYLIDTILWHGGSWLPTYVREQTGDCPLRLIAPRMN